MQTLCAGDIHTTLFGNFVRLHAGTMDPSRTRPLAEFVPSYSFCKSLKAQGREIRVPGLYRK